MFFGSYAMLSCRWFVFDEDGIDADVFDFLGDVNSTISVGLFRYQPLADDDDDSSSSSTVTCDQFDPLFLPGNTWMIMAQVCVILGLILAFVAWVLAMMDVNKHPTTFFLLVATGVQASSVISSMSLCDEFWDCPWLLGSLADVIATILFFVSWLIATFSLVRKPDADDDNDDDDDGDDSQFDKSRDTDDDEDEDDHPSVIVMTGDEESQNNKLTVYYDRPPSSDGKLTAEELLGTNDPIIMNAVRINARVARDMVRKVKAEQEQDQEQQTQLDSDNSLSPSSSSSSSDGTSIQGDEETSHNN
jgi:hypothetical protein